MNTRSRVPTATLAACFAATCLVACGPDSSPTRIAQPVVPSSQIAAARERLSHGQAEAALASVLAANERGIASAPALVPPGAPLAPFIEARLVAIATLAVHDALNAIVPRFARYADTGPVVPNANAAAARAHSSARCHRGCRAGGAGSRRLVVRSQMAGLAGSDGLASGVALGHRTAAAILANRSSDGVAAGGVAPYTPGTNPGDYRFTSPFNTPAFDFFGTGGFADASQWGSTVTSFVLTSTSQFRAPPPYGAASNAAAVLTHVYTEDYDEVKRLGCAGCAARSAEQTEIALFWMENSPTGWNRIARVVADNRNLDAWDAARLFAVMAVGEFDGLTASLESKYYYRFWRPVTAVALAGTDNNPATVPAAGWEVLAFPTPPVPDYPSAHATAGGAGAAVIEALVSGRGQRITTTSGSLPGVSRTFATVGAAAKENADSRVFIGYHFRHATIQGMAQGRRVGAYVASHVLLPIVKEEQ